jgi:hypothetical protein
VCETLVQELVPTPTRFVTLLSQLADDDCTLPDVHLICFTWVHSSLSECVEQGGYLVETGFDERTFRPLAAFCYLLPGPKGTSLQ